MKKISVIIISYNRPHDLLELLEDISRLEHRELLAEVIILNNSSEADYSAVEAFIAAFKDCPFRLINAPENLGVAKGRNYAADLATGDIMFFTDDDVTLKDTQSLQKLANIFNETIPGERRLGVVSLKVFYKATGDYQVTAFPHKKFDKYRDKHQFLTSYYAGCAHAKSAEAWKAAGKYPADFFYGMEEYDFSYRVLDAGYSIKYDDAILVLHDESPLGRKPKAEKLKMMWLNKSIVAKRYLPKKYFYSTAILWSFFFLVKSGFRFSLFFKGWKELRARTHTEKRRPVSAETMAYLKKTEARLWY